MNHRPKFLLLTVSQWQLTIGLGVLAALGSYPWWQDLSAWAACVAALVAVTSVHMGYASAVVMPLPHLAILVCALQYGLAPWAAYYYPTEGPEFWISNFPYYFSYAGPALLAILLGWAVSCAGFHPKPPPTRQVNPRSRLARELDWMLWGGIGFKLLLGDPDLGGFSFLILLVQDLRFLGATGLMLLRVPGWRWRAVTLLVLEADRAVGGGMFHELLLWSAGFFAVYAYTRRPSLPAFLVWLLVLSGGIFVLNDTKWQIRASTWEGTGQLTVFGQQLEFSTWNKPIVGGMCLVQSTTKLITGGYSDDSLGDMVMRLNQGWIIDRVLHHVPDIEPLAYGETIMSALFATLAPRVFFPDKHDVGGREFMERFAGYRLNEGTSMNIGFAGEMYANFGYLGGIIGCGIYALLLGVGFRWIAARAQLSPLWWAIAIYVGHWALKAETDIGAVLNYLGKAAIVVYLAARFLPGFRAELAGRAPVASPRRLTKQGPARAGGQRVGRELQRQ